MFICPAWYHGHRRSGQEARTAPLAGSVQSFAPSRQARQWRGDCPTRIAPYGSQCRIIRSAEASFVARAVDVSRDLGSILERAAAYLSADGALIFEVGAGRADEVVALASKHGFTHERTHRDLGGIERAVVFIPTLSV